MSCFEHFEMIVQKNPNATALIAPNINLSYQQLYDLVLAQVEMFRENNQNITLEAHAPDIFIASLFACDKLGLCFTPLESSLAEKEKNQIENIIKNSESELSDISMVQFTSGSTGEPKGIKISKDAMFYRAMNLAHTLELTSKDKTLCSIPLSHSHGIDCLVLTTLLTGGELHIMNPRFAAPTTVLSYLEDFKITFIAPYLHFTKWPWTPRNAITLLT